jgi:hypothetical protein
MSYALVKSILVLLGLVAALAVFTRRVDRLVWANLRRGQPGERFGRWGERIKGLVLYVAAQLRLFRFLVPGTSHFFISGVSLFCSRPSSRPSAKGFSPLPLPSLRSRSWAVGGLSPCFRTFSPHW